MPKGEKKIYGRLPHYITILLHLCAIPFTSRENKENMKEYMKVVQVYHELIKNKSHLYDGDIELLAVSKERRGLGIGKRLMDCAKERFQRTGAKSIYVYTDTCCNYGFYDSQGFLLEGSEDLELTLNGEPFPLSVCMYVFHA